MLRLTLLSILVAACLADTVTFSNFGSSRLSELQLNGEAAQLNPNQQNFLFLTDANFNMVGSAFLKNNISLVDLLSFSTFFSFQMTQPGGTVVDQDGAGADGFVFVINSVTNVVGSVGQGLGYQGLDRSVGIEFDTYQNDGDINGNHVGIDTNGRVDGDSVAVRAYPTRLNNGQVYYAWVDYNGNTQNLQVRVSNDSTRPSDAFLSITLNLMTILRSSNVYVGFTAATGSGFENHIIREWTFSNFYNPISTCGNGIKEGDEECDGGSCCTSDCKLINTPTCFCSRQNFGGSDMGYFCDGRGGFYQCLNPSGPFASQSSHFDCPAGTQCGCAVGPECSCGKTQSPCVSSYPQVCQN